MNHPFFPWLLLGVSLLIIAEMIWSWRTGRHVYEWRETLANLAVFAGFQLSQKLLSGYKIFWMSVFSGVSLWQWPRNGWTFLLTFLLADFLYYWHHRVMHEWKFFWAFHVVHHSGRHFNLTTSYRLNWFGSLTGIFFYLPLIILGLPAPFIAASLALNLFFQFFLHTEAVGKLGWLEGILNTPAAHRVHHGSNERYLDKNYGGVLIVWDRLFGTYEPETEVPVYGITTGFVSNNPVTLVLHGFTDFLRGRMVSRG